MLLNKSVKCGGYRQMGRSWWQLSLSDTTIEEVAALSAPYEVYEDDGETLVASFADYVKDDVKRGTEEGAVRLDIVRELPAESKKAIEALEANMGVLSAQVDATDAKADEAKEMASQAGTDPQLQALAKVQVATMDLSDATCDEVIAFRDYWPEWQPDTDYKHNQPLTYQGRYFRASKDLTSQAIYPPGTAESEYYEVELAADGIIVWYEVGGEYNMVRKGEKRHYPDESGPVYEALEDTSYSPDAYPQHWKLVE